MASLRNQALNQRLPSHAQAKPVPKPVVARAANIIKPLGRNVGQLPNVPAVTVIKQDLTAPKSNQLVTSAKLPTLAGLRDQVPVKRQRILQDVVRTAGKENGLLRFAERPSEVRDIYADDFDNESLVVAYVEHIYTYLYERESVRLSAKYMDGMSVSPRMRAILMDWVVSVSYKFKMCQDTLYLAVDIIDRFLAIPELDVTKDELQLVGVTAMFIASKFEEVYPPELDDYVFIADNACTKAQILDTEMMMVNALNFDFTRPTATHFLRRCCKAAAATTEEYSTCKYISELSILSVDFVEIRPSLIAAAAVYLTMVLRRGKAETKWSADMEYYSRYKELDVMTVAGKLLVMVAGAANGRQQCIYKKYVSSKNWEVAKDLEKMAQSVARYFGIELPKLPEEPKK